MDGGNARPQCRAAMRGRDMRRAAATGSLTVPLVALSGGAEIVYLFRSELIDTLRHGPRFPLSASAAVEANGGSNFPTAEQHHQLASHGATRAPERLVNE